MSWETDTMYAAIVPLYASDRDRIRDHLLRLSPEDRSLRFAAGVVTDDSVCRYVDAIDLERDLVMGLVSKRGFVVGLVHGAVFDHRGRRHVEAAFSVDAAWRGVGFGTRLMEALLLHAAALGDAVVLGQCAVRNRPMRRVFERAGMAMTRSDDEWCARREWGAPCAASAA
ncbi:MAG: GNAT family N-acetyltransferase [Rubrivivax sp.]